MPIASVTIYISLWNQIGLNHRRHYGVRGGLSACRLSVMYLDWSQGEERLVCNAHGDMHSTHVHICMRVILQICPHAQTQTHTDTCNYAHTPNLGLHEVSPTT